MEHNRRRIFQVVEIRLFLYFVAFGNQSNFHYLVFTTWHKFLFSPKLFESIELTKNPLLYFERSDKYNRLRL